MENTLIEENQDLYTKVINGEICLYYKPTYNGKNILKDPKFKKWLNEQEKLKGKEKLLFKCNKCNFITYLKNIEEIDSMKCCEESRVSFWYICPYCGGNFDFGSFCCKRIALKWIFSTTFLNGQYFNKKDNLFDEIKLIPLIFHWLFVYMFFEAFFFRAKIQLKTYECSEKPLIGIGAIFSIVQGFTFFFPFLVLYIIYFFIALTGYELNQYK